MSFKNSRNLIRVSAAKITWGRTKLHLAEADVTPKRKKHVNLQMVSRLSPGHHKIGNLHRHTHKTLLSTALAYLLIRS